jgi:hypothetical protein
MSFKMVPLLLAFILASCNQEHLIFGGGSYYPNDTTIVEWFIRTHSKDTAKSIVNYSSGVGSFAALQKAEMLYWHYVRGCYLEKECRRSFSWEDEKNFYEGPLSKIKVRATYINRMAIKDTFVINERR